MEREYLLQNLSRGFCHVTFSKAQTGETRSMVCTRNLALVPTDQHPAYEAADEGAGPIRVFEKLNAGAGQWRSFYPDTVTFFQPGV